MKKKNIKQQPALGYTVPENYFASSQERMIAQVLAQESSSNRGDRFLWLGIAATFAVLFGLFEMEQTTSSEFDLEFEAIIIDSVVVEEAAFDDWLEEQYILSEY